MPWTSAIFVIAASVMMLRSGAMPAWLGGLGILAGVASVLGGTWIFSGDPGHTVADVGFIGDLAAMLWVAIASVFLIRGAAD